MSRPSGGLFAAGPYTLETAVLDCVTPANGAVRMGANPPCSGTWWLLKLAGMVWWLSPLGLDQALADLGVPMQDLTLVRNWTYAGPLGPEGEWLSW